MQRLYRAQTDEERLENAEKLEDIRLELVTHFDAFEARYLEMR